MNLLWLLVPVAYFIGTFPTALLVGSLLGIDPTESGSGNPGASNMMRLGGKSAGGVTLLVDVVKGVIPTAMGYAADGRQLAAACGVAAILGHIYPIQRKLQGGKGVATFGGMSLVLWLPVGLAGIAAWIATYKLSKQASLGSINASLVVAIGTVVLGRPGWEIAVASGVAALIIVRHRTNIARILRRQESSL